MTVHYCLSQQFFPATSPRLWHKSPVPTHPWQTLDSIVNQALQDWDAEQSRQLLYRALIKRLSCLESLVWSAVIKAIG